MSDSVDYRYSLLAWIEEMLNAGVVDARCADLVVAIEEGRQESIEFVDAWAEVRAEIAKLSKTIERLGGI